MEFVGKWFAYVASLSFFPLNWWCSKSGLRTYSISAYLPLKKIWGSDQSDIFKTFQFIYNLTSPSSFKIQNVTTGCEVQKDFQFTASKWSLRVQ